tara:strand:+ start:1517 stop:1717 length:201 start_codon:yes stop_codon:yes gene_type:complete
MGKVVEFPGRPDLVKLAEEYDALVVIGVNENQIQIISNMEDPDILYSMEVAKSELINAYFTDETIH